MKFPTTRNWFQTTNFMMIYSNTTKQADSQLTLKEHQKPTLSVLEEIRWRFEPIIILCHAIGTRKT